MREQVKKFRKLGDTWTKDAKGNTVLWQRPNSAIIVWFVARLIAWPLHGRWENFVNHIAFGALFAWAWMEIFQGVNVFRRGLGVLVMLGLLISVVN